MQEALQREEKHMAERLRSVSDLSKLMEACHRCSAAFRITNDRTPGSFLNWLSRIADHIIVDEARKRNRKKRHADLTRFRSDTNPIGPEPADSLSPSRLFAEREAVNLLLNQLNVLPDQYREVILLAKIEGLSTQEMAQRLGKPRDAVALLLHRAVRRQIGRAHV